MDARIESIVRTSSELLADYVDTIVVSSVTLMDNLLENVELLASTVIRDATEVVASAFEAFADDEI